MNTKSIADLTSWVATVSAFLLACVGIFSQPVVLQSPRPKLPSSEKVSSIPEQLSGPRAAELWDDPFAVFKQADTLPVLPLAPQHKARGLLLVLLSDSGGYQRDSEVRLRSRYSVESAIRDSGFTSETPGELTETLLQVGSTLDVPGGAIWHLSSFIEVPTESFRRRPAGSERDRNSFCFLRVVWLPEQLLPTAALARLGSFCKEHIAELAPGLPNAAICVIGPTTSDTLASMCRTARDPINARLPRPVNYPRILDYQATAENSLVQMFALQDFDPDAYARYDDDAVSAKIKNLQVVNGTEQLLFSQDGIPIERVGADDFRLCTELVTEIRRRTRTTGLVKPRILLVYESDTLYGRAAARAFKLAAAGIQRQDIVRGALESDKSVADLKGDNSGEFEIDSFSYMRGLDGSATLYDREYPSASPSTEHPSRVETAEGISQYDYIRRLSDSISKPIDQLVPAFREPDAVVILGTDVYDKLTLLKLLRERFEHSLYLTTDLDALYWHPGYVRYTRNLIVAASFPLDVYNITRLERSGGPKPFNGINTSAVSEPGARSDNIPIRVNNLRRQVFRDSYQTALYNATVAAIKQAPVDRWQTTAKLFEIGNSKAVQLGAPGWTRLITPNVWDGYLQGVSSWPSLCVQTILLIVGAAFLFKLHRVKFEQRLLPKEFFANVKLRVPTELTQPITDFAKVLNDAIIWSSEFVPNKKKLTEIQNSIDEVLTQLDDLVGQSAESAIHIMFELRKALGELMTHFYQPPPNGIRATWLANISYRRNLRVTPYWITKLASPLLAPSAKGNGALNTEIEEFVKYSDTKQFVKNPFYITILFSAAILVSVYFLFNQNFEGIVGPELRDIGLRWYRIVVSLFGMGLILAVVVWTCSEQWRCRNLVRNLLKSVGERSALVDRQIISVVAEKSNEVARLSWQPCVLLFLFYVSHLRVFVGPSFDWFHWCIFVGLLLTVCVYFFLLSFVASDARRRVLSEYEQEILMAKRLDARLASIVKDDEPIQNDLQSTTALLNDLVTSSSNVTAPSEEERVKVTDLVDKTTRQSIRDYLNSVVNRNEKILDIVTDLRSGAFAPF
ncbi:MAG: hypothetical protein JO333_01330, partial [Verrucomicrobia bacterium]|nr:hypothetical protein [Verrucomicrobiota bacterium]